MARGLVGCPLAATVVTLINSTVGIAALSIPFCFYQCGVILSLLIILITAVSCVASCDLLIGLFSHLKGSSFETACLRYLSGTGKIACEISIIGLMVGSIVNFNVGVADFGWDVASMMMFGTRRYLLRAVIMGLVTVAITPLCLIFKIHRLSRFNAFAMPFYSLLVIHMAIFLGGPNLRRSLPYMTWWKPSGLARCLPIFFGSLFCQTQLHSIYLSLCEPSVAAMRTVVRFTVAVIAVSYALFGFLGYAAFAQFEEFRGNVFIMYPMDAASLMVQVGFLLSVTFSMPLVFFPLRESLNGLLWHRGDCSSFDVKLNTEPFIPIRRFRIMTVSTLIICCLLSLTTDKVEVTLELTSSLAASLSGFILPALVSLSAFGVVETYKERTIACYLLFVGVLLFCLGVYPLIGNSESTMNVLAVSAQLVNQSQDTMSHLRHESVESLGVDAIKFLNGVNGSRKLSQVSGRANNGSL